jgi:hypothetical protein
MSNERERITREITVSDYEFMDGEGSERKNARKDIIAVYYSPRNSDSAAYRELLKTRIKDEGENAVIPYSEMLQTRFKLKELRNVDTEKSRGKILYEMTRENLADETDHNLKQIVTAIDNDVSPKPTPAS